MTPACNVPSLQGGAPLTWGLQKVRRGTAQGAKAAGLGERRSEEKVPQPYQLPAAAGHWEGGLRAAEGRWRDALAGRGLMARGVPAARAGQRMLRNPAFEAPWMHPPPPRVAPDERRARAAARTERTAQRPPVPDDTADPLAPAGRRSAWASVWSDIYDVDIDRRHRCTAFRILHGQLRVGMFMGYVRHHDSAEACCCPHSAGAGAGQSLSHVFLACVFARPVVAWLAQVWGSMTGQLAPPLTAAVLLAGDHRGWPVAPALQPLWERLRLLRRFQSGCIFCLRGRSHLTGASTRPQRKACKTSVTAPPPKERARKGVPRTEQRARTQAQQDGHSARNAKVCQATHKPTAQKQGM